MELNIDDKKVAQEIKIKKRTQNNSLMTHKFEDEIKHLFGRMDNINTTNRMLIEKTDQVLNSKNE